MVWSFFVTVCIIKHKIMILDVLRDTIDLYFWFVYLYVWIKAADCINFASIYFFFEERSFTHTNTNVHLVWTNMVKCLSNCSSLFFNHVIIVEITNFASSFISSFSLIFFFFKFFEFSSPVFSLLLKFFNVGNYIIWCRLHNRLIILLHF